MIENRWRKKAKPPKLGRRRRRLFYIKVAILFLIVVGLCVGIIMLSRADGLQVSTIRISGNSTVISTDLTALAQTVASGTYLAFFPRSNVALYPRDSVAVAIRENFPQIAEVSVDTNGLNNLDIAVIERLPVGLWCGRGASGERGLSGRCYFLDEGGYIYAKAPDFSGPVFIRYYGQDSDPAPLRSQYLPATTFRALQLFLSGVRKLGFTPESFLIRDDVDFELWLDTGAKIYFSRAQDFGITLENLQSILDSTALIDKKLTTIDYIDLRFGSKVYVKEKK